MFSWPIAAFAALLVAQPEAATDTFAVGSWIVNGGQGDGAQHVAMTLSSQGSGVIAFTCSRERPGVILGLNKARFRAPVGGRTVLRYTAGNERIETEAAVISEETVQLDQEITRDLLARTHDGTVLTFSLPRVDGDDIELVFRPVESTRALAALKAACRI
jgi:hypothetical protein